MSRRPLPRGFTLVELLVSLVVVAIMTAGAMGLVINQQRMLQGTSADRALQETARGALGELTTNLRRAGFGLEPALAFDFDSYACATPVTCRDRIATSDEIVFRARDPGWRARLAAKPTAGTLTIVGGLQRPLHRGQILQVMCAAAADVAYVTVDAVASANWVPPAAAPAATAITLAAGTTIFPNQISRLTAAGSCFDTEWSNARVYRVEQFRYYVASFADPTEGTTGGLRPYLMLDSGLSDATGARLEPVSADVEDLQFEYEFVTAATGAPRVVGAASGVQLTSSATGIDLAVAAPTFDLTAGDPIRATNHPGNIRAVRVSVVVRSPGTDVRKNTPMVQLMSAQGPRMPAAGNRPVRTDVVGNHLRMRFETSAAIRNLESRSAYFEP